MRNAIIAVALLGLTFPPSSLPSSSGGSEYRPPDARGEAWDDDVYRGVRANVVIPQEMRRRNEVGTPGGGLCVIASADTAGRYQGIGAETAKLWAVAKRRPGGYSPQRLEALINEVSPGLKFASYLGSDPAVLERLSAAGYPISATMNTGRLYNYRRIAHMVNVPHFSRSQNLAAVVDNNKPEVTAWMPADEYIRRWAGDGGGWAFVWDYPPALRAASSPVASLAIALWAVVIAVSLRRLRFADHA